MKKLLFPLMLSFLLVAGCSSEEVSEDQELDVEEQEEVKEEEQEEEKVVEDKVEEKKEQEEEEDEQEKEEVEESEESKKIEESYIESSKVEELITYAGMGEGDKLISVDVKDGEVRAEIELGDNDFFEPKDMAVTSYSQASDELLNHDGWETLTITYVGVGTISLDRSEKETNEVGDYFPTLLIEEKLK